MIESNIEEVTLKLQTGKTPPSKEEKYFNGDINWYTPADLKTKLLGKSERTITELAHMDKKALIYPRGTVLLSCIGDIGKLGITTDDKSSSNQQITGLIPDTTKITSEYLYYWCLAHKYVFQLKGTSVTVPMLNNKRLRKIKISYTESIDDQIKIANLLSQVEALIAKREESIKLLDELLKSTFLDMFGDPVLNTKGWDTKSFNYFAKIDTNMTTEFDKYKNYPHIGVGNIEKDTGKILDYKLIKDENIVSGKYLFTPEHIIYSKIRPNLNKVALPNFSGLASADSYPILVKKDVTNKYFFAYVLRSDAFIRFILNFSLRANIPKVNKKQLEKFSCINPPKPLQDKFATIVQQVEESKKKYQESLNELHQLFGSLSQRAFKGELDLSGVETPTTLDLPTFMHKVDAEEHSKSVESYVDESNRPVYSEDFLWMILSQADDDISYESIASKLEKYSFKESPDYDRIKFDIFSLIEQKKLKQLFDNDTKSMKLVKAT